jgi:hypothetical protein
MNKSNGKFCIHKGPSHNVNQLANGVLPNVRGELAFSVMAAG